MRKLLLKCFLSPGDIVMLTAAVRDLHLCYPERFLTDVRTTCPEIWEHNPRITPLDETDPEVETIECHYPLINRCNQAPYHFVHGFAQFLNEKLGLSIQPTLFKGDIHLSEHEKVWYSQVHELTGEDTPFWIVVAGGKYDITIKWWDAARYQAVVDRFRGKVQFVQVGELGHHHPRLNGVIDLRGKTDFRQLIRLVYHAQGVLSPITGIMHLAAAVESKYDRTPNRPCVVVAGGREPVHWEAYPHHQFIHTIGALPCCSSGCWKSRTLPLGDGEDRDAPGQWCVEPVGQLPRCMDMITSEEVARRIELYFAGGACQYLTPAEARAAATGVEATASSAFDDAPLNVHSFRLHSERFIQRISAYPEKFRGRGIVICAGGIRYFTNAWVCINMLRRLGCSLPIQLWHLGTDEIDSEMAALARPLGVECVDACTIRKQHPARVLHGWALKPYAILHCPFREVLLLDADNVPVRNPEYLFDTAEFRSTGAIFWPDFDSDQPAAPVWRFCGASYRQEESFESGQIVVDKARCWEPLNLAMWYNEQSDFLYKHIYGDKDTYHLAFRRLGVPYSMPSRGIHPLEGTMCQHDFEGNRVFQHRSRDKWNLFLTNKRVRDFWFEEECRQSIEKLQTQWDGRSSHYNSKPGKPRQPRPRASARRRVPSLSACMISCPQRETARAQTLRNLGETDWQDRPIWIEVDRSTAELASARMVETAFAALNNVLMKRADYILLLEDDLEFNHHLLRNLITWPPLREGRLTLAALYNPGVAELACDVQRRFFVADPYSVYGSQALLMSRATVHYILEHWGEIDQPLDHRLARLAGRLNQPILYHSPSIIQHIGRKSTRGGHFHRAADFDPDWLASTIDKGFDVIVR